MQFSARAAPLAGTETEGAGDCLNKQPLIAAGLGGQQGRAVATDDESG
jgi:hypothetical protein